MSLYEGHLPDECPVYRVNWSTKASGRRVTAVTRSTTAEHPWPCNDVTRGTRNVSYWETSIWLHDNNAWFLQDLLTLPYSLKKFSRFAICHTQKIVMRIQRLINWNDIQISPITGQCNSIFLCITVVARCRCQHSVQNQCLHSFRDMPLKSPLHDIVSKSKQIPH